MHPLSFIIFLAASAANNSEKIAMIQSAASAASAKGGCTSSRLDHGLKFYVIQGGCASSRLILMHLARGLSSKLIIPPCVRPSVRASPSSGKLKTYVFAPYFLKFQKITYVFDAQNTPQNERLKS